MDLTALHNQTTADGALSLAEKAGLGLDIESFQNRMSLRIQKVSHIKNQDTAEQNDSFEPSLKLREDNYRS